MQRLADRIYKEFAFAEQPIQIHARDGNGDLFEVFKGSVSALTAYSFLPVLQDPGCFYFFSIACSAQEESTDAIMRRDLCWLTDPLPPQLEASNPTRLAVSWLPVTFCGVCPPHFLDSVTYSLEVAEGVEWKDGMLARYITDATALDYREVCHVQQTSFFVLDGLRPATWYHIRLVVHYLGFRVASEAATLHTAKSIPSPPGRPRVSIVPVKSSFDVTTDQPARLDVLITWTPACAHGCAIQRYQVHVKRFDLYGQVCGDDPPLLRKRKALPDISSSTQGDRVPGRGTAPNPRANQWTQSRGKCAAQVQQALAARSPGRAASPGGDKRPATSPGHSGVCWRIVYDNLSRGLRMGSPRPGDGTWWIRIRAKNALGWSPFSEVAVLSRSSHPTLFAGQGGAAAAFSPCPSPVPSPARLGEGRTSSPPVPEEEERAEKERGERGEEKDGAGGGEGDKPQTPFSRFENMLKRNPNPDRTASGGLATDSPPSLHWGTRSGGGDTASPKVRAEGLAAAAAGGGAGGARSLFGGGSGLEGHATERVRGLPVIGRG